MERVCVWPKESQDTRDSASEEVEVDMPAGEADVQAVPSESRDLASEIFFYGKELLLAQCVSRKDRCQHVCRGSSVSGNVLPGSTWDWVSRV